MDVNTNNRSRNAVGRTRFFDLHTKRIDIPVQNFSFLIGYGELVTETMHGLLEVRYLFF